MSLPPRIVTPRIGLLRRAGLAAVLLSSLLLAPRGLGGEAAELRALRLQQEGAVTRLFVDLSAATGYRFFTLDNPRRAVIDLESARDASRGALPAPTGAVSGLRTGAQPGGALRVVVELRPGAKATMGAPLLRPAGSVSSSTNL